MAWLPLEELLPHFPNTPPTGYIHLHVDQLFPLSLEGWAFLAIRPVHEAEAQAWMAQHTEGFQHFFRLLSGEEMPDTELTEDRLYLCLEMQRKRLYQPYRALLEALVQIAPYLEDASFFLKEEHTPTLDFFRVLDGTLFVVRYACTSACEDDILRAYDAIAEQDPEDQDLREFVSLRRLRVVSDFIDQLFAQHSDGISLTSPLSPPLEVKLHVIAEGLQRAAAHTPDAIDVWHQWARFAVWFGEPATIQAAFDAVYQLDPTDPWVHFDHAVYLWQQGQIPEAMSHHHHFLAAEPHDPLGLLFAGFLYTKEDRHDDASSVWQALDQQVDTLLSDLSRWKDLQRPEYAADLLALWLQHAHHFLSPKTLAQAHLRAALLLQTWQPWESLSPAHREIVSAWLQHAHQTDPHDPLIALHIARNLRKQGRLEDAHQTLLQAHNEHPLDTDILFLLGQLCAQREHNKEAAVFLQRLITQTKDRDDYHADLYKAQLAAVLDSEAQRLWLEEDYHAAESVYDQIIAVYEDSFIPPGLETPWLQKARLRLREDKKGLALASAHKALSIHPASAHANALTAYILAHMDRFSEALPHAQRALSQQPHDPFALYTKACLFAMTGRRKEAIPLLERALLANPSLRYEAAQETLLQRLHALSLFWKLLDEPETPST